MREMTLEQLHQNYDHLVANYPNLQLAVELFKQDPSSSWKMPVPLTPLSKEVVSLVCIPSTTLYHTGNESGLQRICKRTKKGFMPIKAKHGQDELAHLAEEIYSMIWLSVLEHHHQLNWPLEMVYPLNYLPLFAHIATWQLPN